MSSPFADRVNDLLRDAQDHAARFEWDAVRTLATAALALEPGSADARHLLAAADAASPAVGERRQLTVMFCDVVGSTALTRARDPEVVRDVLRSYQAAVDDVVRRFGGHIAKIVGDGVLVYFGYPVAHEDDPRRAVRAGLDLLDALRPITDDVHTRFQMDLAIRVAVHTGIVVRAEMGPLAAPDRDAITGDTPNLAARLQDQAAPGTLVISEATLELVRSWFLVAPLGARTLKGIDDQVEMFEVIEEIPAAARIQTQADLTPHVGREAEQRALTSCWEDVLQGASRAMVITGEAGVGKSRLADVARRRAATEGTGLTAACSSYQTDQALYPVKRLLEQVAGIESSDDHKQALSRLWAAMDAVGLAESLPYFADLLGIEPQPWCPPPELDGLRLREEMLSTLVKWVRVSAADDPLLLVVDDLQWADPTSLELIGRLVAAAIPRVMLVLTARSPFTSPWRSAEHLELVRLSDDELTELARRLPGGSDLSPAALQTLIQRSDGVPLYFEELVRIATTARHAESDIPPALRDILLARFAAPGVDLRFTQMLATIGNEVPLSIARQVSRLAPEEFDRQVAALLEAGLVTRADPDGDVVRFRHHLMAELAYDTQLQTVRASSHAAVADVLAELPASDDIGDAGALAHHLERAGRHAPAIDALTNAAEVAYRHGAFTEATSLLEHAFELLDQVEGDDRAELEFEVRLLRGMTAAATIGYAAPQAVIDFDACGHLVGGIHPEGFLDEGPSSHRAWSVLGLWATMLLQGRLDDCEAILDDLRGQLRPDGTLRRYFDGSGGFIEFFRGDYPAAIAKLDQAEKAASRLTIPYRMPLPHDIEVVAMAHVGFALAVRGEVAAARASFDRARERSNALSFPRGPFSFCYTAGVESACARVLGDIDRHQAIGAALVEVAERHGFTFWTLIGTLNGAMFDLAKGDLTAADRVGAMTTMMRAMQVKCWVPLFNATTAEAHLDQGRPEQAVPVIAEALEVADETGVHFWTSVLRRLEGQARLGIGERDAGFACLDEAVAIAVQQGARLLEVEARTTLVEERADPDDVKGLLQQIDDLVDLDDSALPALSDARRLAAAHR